MSTILSTKGLSKKYGSLRAVDDLNLTIPSGKIFGILGPNGSGKTTTLGMILGVTKPNAGTYQWFENKSPIEARQSIGALLETPNYYPYLSAWQNLKIQAIIKGASNEDIENVLRKVYLWDRRSSNFSSYSLGMKQRLAIAGAMLSDPEILVLDEPTNGLDPNGIVEVRSIIQQLGKEGKSIILASHLLDEVEKICTDVAILKQGKLLSVGPVQAQGAVILLEMGSTDMALLDRLLLNFPLAKNIQAVGGLRIAELPVDFDPALLNVYMIDNGLVLNHLLVKQRTLESYFLEVTK